MAQVKFINDDPDTILKDVISTEELLTGKTFQRGQPEYDAAARFAYRAQLLYQRVNAAFNSMIITNSSAPIIDFLCALTGTVRTPAQTATCTLKFILVSGHAALTISAGTRVSSGDGLAIFAVDYDTPVGLGVNEIEVSATCETAGLIGNGYAPGNITQIMDAQAYITSCSNVDTTANGSDVETDEQLRTRQQLDINAIGSSEKYTSMTYGCSPLIVDVKILTAQDVPTITPGNVEVYALLKDGQKPSLTLRELINTTLTAKKVKQLNDNIVVNEPLGKHFTIGIEAIKLKSFTGNSDSLVSAISAILDAYKLEMYAKLGNDVIASDIESRCRIAGIYDLTVTITPINASLTGRNLIVKGSEFGYLDSYTVNIVDINEG